MLLAVLCGCASSGGGERVIARLVDVEPADVATGAAAPAQDTAYSLDGVTPAPRGPSRERIDDDLRYTFPRAKRQLVYRDPSRSLPAAAELELAIGLPQHYRDCTRLAADVMMTNISQSAFGGRSTSVRRGAIGACRAGAAGPELVLHVDLPTRLRGRPADVWVAVGPVEDDAPRRRRFTIARTPSDARLRFSYAVDPAAWSRRSPAAVFRVRADGERKPLFEARVDPGREPRDRRWLNASVDLGRFAGRALTLVLETEPAGGGGVTLPVWGNPVLLAATDARPRPPNLLLVSIDTLRARSVSAYGADRPTTPFLDRFAQDGALFENVLAQAPDTPESHMSIFTSLNPMEHGVTGLRKSDLKRYQTLAEILRGADYSTGAVTEDGLLVASVGFTRGFDYYRENKSAQLLLPQGHVESTFADGIAWMRTHRRDPFFLFLHTYQVHSPYTPPPGYLDRFARAMGPGPEAALDRYEEEIRYVDDQLARLWSEVVALGLADDTVVVITADHGDQFGEHGAIGHSADLYDEVMHVPLIIRGPGVTSRTRVAEPVASIDILPTVLELLALPPSPQARGRSLVAALAGDPARRSALLSTLRDRRIYAESFGVARQLVDREGDETWRTPIFSEWSGRWKVIWRPSADGGEEPGDAELYDLDVDPLEHHPMSPDLNAETTAMHHDLEAYAAAAIAALSGHAPVTPDPGTAAKLRALGYVR